MGKIVLIGATGFVGTAILKEALGRGHKVRAVMRHPEKLIMRHPNLTVQTVDIMHPETLAVALSGSDAIISAYNPGWDNPELYEDTLIGYDSIVYATLNSGVHRLLVVGGAGSLLVSPGVHLMDTGKIPPAILPGVKSMAKVYTDILLHEDKVDWIYFCPAATLEPGERTGRYRMGKDELISDENGVSRISVEDYAKAMIDELEQPMHHCERFTIGY